MFVVLISLAAALAAGPQSTTEGTASAPRPGTAPASSVSAVSTATPGTAPVSTLGSAPSAAGERVVCTNTQVTGTRFPIRRCRTLSQLNSERNEARDQLNQSQVNRMPAPN